MNSLILIFFSKFNQDLNWEHLAERKVPPPFVPKISHELDVGNFATEFTNMAPQDSPAAVPMNVEKMFKVLLLQIISHFYCQSDISHFIKGNCCLDSSTERMMTGYQFWCTFLNID